MKELFLVAALATQPMFVHHEYDEASKDLFTMLSNYAGKHNSISLLSKGYDRVDLKIIMDRLTPGGFLFIELNGQAMKFLRKRNFEMTGFVWKSYTVYRKPTNGTRKSA